METLNDERKEITKDVLNEQLMEKTKGMTEEEYVVLVVMVVETGTKEKREGQREVWSWKK